MAKAIATVLRAHVEQAGAVHMTWGAINGWTTQAAYARLAQRCNHPGLAEMLRRILRQEGRQIDFYASRASRRLDAIGVPSV